MDPIDAQSLRLKRTGFSVYVNAVDQAEAYGL
jgi:hypothetical protein